MTKFVAFTEKQWHDLDDKLTEIQQAITLYARGHDSTASGILGVDESWTITAN